MGHAWTPGDWILVISAIFAGISSTIGAWHARKANNKATVAADKSDIAAERAVAAASKVSNIETKSNNNAMKLETIHSLTNGNLCRTQEELEVVKKRRDFLENLVIELSARLPIGALEEATRDLEYKQAQIGKRRKTDIQQ